MTTMYHHVKFTLVFICALATMIGCSPSPDELYKQGREAAQNKEFDKALALYQQIKETASDDIQFQFKAQFGESEVYRAQGNLENQAKVLEALFADQSFEKERSSVSEKLAENYLIQADQQKNKDDDPEKVTKLLQQAIKVQPDSPANQELALHWQSLATRAFKTKQFDQALTLFTQAKSLNIKDESLKKKLAIGMNQVKLQKYILKAEKLFAIQRNSLEKSGSYDHKTKMFYVKVVTDVEGKVRKKTEADMTKAGTAQAIPLAQVAVGELIKKIFNTSKKVNVNSALLTSNGSAFARRAKRVKRGKKKVKVTEFTYNVSISLDQIYRLAYQAQ